MIASIGYDKANSTLEIEFNSGAVWQYFDFPKSKWHEFENADSQGRFFLNEIQDCYEEVKVG